MLISSPYGVSWIVGLFKLGEVLLISSSSGVFWIVGLFKIGGVLLESLQRYCVVVARDHKNLTSGENDGRQRHTWLETDLAWYPTNSQIDGSPWQEKWHHYLPWSVSTYNFGRVFVIFTKRIVWDVIGVRLIG
jgi:hypothetical protein